MTIDRRNFIAGAGAAFSLAVTSRASFGAEPAVFLTPLGYLIDFLEVMNAYSGGHFKKAGVDVKVVAANTPAIANQQLVAGKAEFDRGAAIDMIKAVAKQNVPLISIATIFQTSTFGIISDKSKPPILKAEDMRGKTIGVVSVGGSTESFLDLMLTKVGVPKEEVPRQAVGGSPSAFGLIKQGRIDAFIASSNSVTALREQGEQVQWVSTDVYAPMPSQCYFTTRAIVEKQPELILGFIKGVKASVDEIMKGPVEPLIDRAAKDFDIPGIRDKAHLATSIEENFPLWLGAGKENLLRNVPELWKAGCDAMAAAKIAEISDPRILYTNKFVDEALKA